MIFNNFSDINFQHNESPIALFKDINYIHKNVKIQPLCKKTKTKMTQVISHILLRISLTGNFRDMHVYNF